MTDDELQMIARGMAPVVKQAIAQAVEPLLAKIAEIEARAMVAGPMGPAGPDGAHGRDGKDGAPGLPGEKGMDGAAGRDGKDGAQGPRGEKGADGLNGKDGASGIDGKDGAAGVNGKDGAPGAPGARGEKGVDGVNGKDAVLPDITALVKAEVGRWPVPKDGRSVTVEDLAPLVTTSVEKAVAALPRPVDPVSFTGALIERDGTLVLTTSDGGTKRVGLVVGKDGADGRHGTDVSPEHVAQIVKAAVDQIPRPQDGKDGADGIGFDDLSLDFDEQKGFSLRFVRGALEKSWPIQLPYYAGIWQSGRPYVKSATVTAQGALWIALKDTTARPGEQDEASRDWKLCVKGGRDGKPGRDGKDGTGA